MLFIRFHGCPLACPWCDEPLHRDPAARREMLAEQLLQAVRRLHPRLPYLLLTGGEPLAVPRLAELVDFFKQQGFWQAMETSGVGGPIPEGVDWLTLSPKTKLAEAIYQRANEVKYVIGPSPSPRLRAEILQRAELHPNVWVQPRSGAEGNRQGQAIINPQAVAACLQLIDEAAGTIRLSLQLHKWLNLP